MMKAFLIVLGFVSELCFSTHLMANEKPEISPAQARLMIKNIVRELNQTYIDPKKAKPASDELVAKLKAGAFGGGTDFFSFRRAILSILVKATRDSGFELTRSGFENTLDVNSQNNAGIKSEVLENNIGYLEMTGAFNFPQSSQVIEQYFKNMSGVDALIIDLRSVDKGSVDLSQKMMSFFVEPTKAIGSVKSSHSIEILKAIDTPGFEKFKQDFPLYILNSAFVAGPWELFSYTLQALDKSIIIGEVTMGVGFIQHVTQISNGVAIEMTQAIVAGSDPTKTWNDQGVVPDHFSKPDEALEKAYHLALSQMTKK